MNWLTNLDLKVKFLNLKSEWIKISRPIDLAQNKLFSNFSNSLGRKCDTVNLTAPKIQRRDVFTAHFCFYVCFHFN